MKATIDRIMASKFATWDEAVKASGRDYPPRIYDSNLLTIYNDPTFTVFEQPSTHARCAIIWDEDYDTRVLDVAKVVLKGRSRQRVWIMGERKGNLLLVGNVWEKTPEFLGGAEADQKTKVLLSTIDRAIRDDYWPVEIVSCARDIDPVWFQERYKNDLFVGGIGGEYWHPTYVEMIRFVDFFQLDKKPIIPQ